MAGRERLEYNLFTDEAGDSIGFYIHESVKEAERGKVIKAIKKNGGKVLDTDLGVDTVVVDPSYPAAYTLQTKYRVHSDRRYWRTNVEDTEFVFDCIKIGEFKHAPVQRQAMRGNRPGRVDYTKKDEEMLCRYLAIRTPNSESGGRLGHRIYQELVDLGILDPKEYGWALRHPPESWREHYRSKKNKSRLDALIRRYVPKLNPTEEQLYPFDRRLNSLWPPPRNERMEQHLQEKFDQYWQQRNKRLRTRQIAERQEEEESSEEEPEAESSDDEYHRPSSLFSAEEEADDDGAPENLDTRDVSTRRGRVPNEPDNSQMTLVGQTSAYKSPIRPSQVGGGAAPSQTHQEDLDDDNEDERQSRTPSPEPTAVAGRAQSPQMSVSPVVSNPVKDLPRQTRRAAQAAPATDAPYRNTRARSVEVLPPITALQTRRRKRNVVVEPSLSPPEEAEEEHSTKTMPNMNHIGEEAKGGDPVQKSSRSKGRKRQRVVKESPDNNQEPVSVPEILHEEADVVRMLAVQSIGSSGSSIQQQQQPTPGHFLESGKSGKPGSSQRSLEHTRSMDTDDEQIHMKLNSSNASQGVKVHDPLDLLEGFNNSRTSGRHSLAASIGSSTRTTRPLLLPETETTEHTDELLVTPSEYSFPLPGTRANVVKKRYEEERKKEEYIPPPSTRAAKSKRTSRR